MRLKGFPSARARTMIALAWLMGALPSSAEDHGQGVAPVVETPGPPRYRAPTISCCFSIWDNDSAHPGLFEDRAKAETLRDRDCNFKVRVSADKFQMGQAMNAGESGHCTDVKVIYNGHNYAGMIGNFYMGVADDKPYHNTKALFPNLRNYSEVNHGCMTLGGVMPKTGEQAQELYGELEKIRQNLPEDGSFEVLGNQTESAMFPDQYPYTETSTRIRVTKTGGLQQMLGGCQPAGQTCFAADPDYDRWMCNLTPTQPLVQYCCGAKQLRNHGIQPGKWKNTPCAP